MDFNWFHKDLINFIFYIFIFYISFMWHEFSIGGASIPWGESPPRETSGVKTIKSLFNNKNIKIRTQVLFYLFSRKLKFIFRRRQECMWGRASIVCEWRGEERRSQYTNYPRISIFSPRNTNTNTKISFNIRESVLPKYPLISGSQYYRWMLSIVSKVKFLQVLHQGCER